MDLRFTILNQLGFQQFRMIWSDRGLSTLPQVVFQIPNRAFFLLTFQCREIRMLTDIAAFLRFP